MDKSRNSTMTHPMRKKSGTSFVNDGTGGTQDEGESAKKPLGVLSVSRNMQRKALANLHSNHFATLGIPQSKKSLEYINADEEE